MAEHKAFTKASALAGRDITEREMEIIRLLCSGAPRQTVADSLFIDELTVKNHQYHIYHKLRIHSKFELLLWFLRKYPEEATKL